MKPEHYTERFHARRILLMLSQEKPCKCCPVQKNATHTLTEHDRIKGLETTGIIKYTGPCLVCRKFSGVVKEHGWCPCNVLGPKETAKRAWIKLEEMGLV